MDEKENNIRQGVYKMRRFSIAVFIVIAILLGNPAMALNWQLHDFGDSPFDVVPASATGSNNDWAPINYPHVGALPSPGGAQGEHFDLEGFFVHMDGKHLYVALTSSFGMYATTSYYPGQKYYHGDIFFGTGDYNANTYAIDFGQTDELIGNTTCLRHIAGVSGIPDQPGSYYGTWVEGAVGAYQVTDWNQSHLIEHTLTEFINAEASPLGGGGPHGVWAHEFKIDLDYFDWNLGDELFFNTTISCGNDLIHATYTMDAIPEPCTMILLGLGMVGIGIINRRK